MSTKEKLVAALTKANAPEWMIKNARNGQYDDFEASIPCPITQLVEDCRTNELVQIAEQAINGDFDATKEESDAWFEREGKGVLRDLANEK